MRLTNEKRFTLLYCRTDGATLSIVMFFREKLKVNAQIKKLSKKEIVLNTTGIPYPSNTMETTD